MKHIAWTIASMLAAASCGSNGVAPLRYDAAALELENGGLDMTDEAPAFGDPVVGREFTGENIGELVGTDPEQHTTTLDREALQAGDTVHYLALGWGGLRLPRHPGDSRPAVALERTGTDWSGTICGSSDAVRVTALRTTHFEPATDEVTDRGPRCVAFNSMTFGHWDGILLRIVVSATERIAAPAIVLTTAQYSATVPVSEIGDLHRIVDLGNGKKVAMSGLRQHASCAKGFADGRWIKLDERGGVFQGQWASRSGGLAGHIRGFYGRARDGQQKFFGKIISTQGSFVGRLRGTYRDGYFRAVFEGRAGRATGVMFGRYDGEDGRGTFQARWSAECEGATEGCQCLPEDNVSSSDSRAPCECGTL
jgi:hypothetical protein